jgi:S-DNA-T family DNA segregation ATPase FtsK/SpoIIIE
VSQISSLARDLALALSAERLRVEAPVPGRSYVGIEVPNMQSKMVRLRPILESEGFQKLRSPLSLALGQDVSGQPVIADLVKMPHLLIAGTTGSGKSVCVSAITTCLLMNNSPDNLRIAMLDPKMVELVRFNGVPHLLGKVETSIDRMVGVLRWAISEMDQRYRLLEEARARDLDAYNTKMLKKNQATLPRIVIIVDELADLMLSSPDQTEHSLVRLAQMARAVGMHLIVATQRPSVDVVTGLIKANFPARIAFTVASSIDSRVILDMNGAESLMGKGDMLFLAPDVGAPQRAQGVIVTDHEIDQIIDFWRQSEQIRLDEPAPWEVLMKVMEEEGGDDLVKQAIELVKTSRRASASLLQRRLRIGFPRAARLLDQLEEMGIVGPSQGGGKDREVMIDPNDDWKDMKNAGEDEE